MVGESPSVTQSEACYTHWADLGITCFARNERDQAIGLETLLFDGFFLPSNVSWFLPKYPHESLLVGFLNPLWTPAIGNTTDPVGASVSIILKYDRLFVKDQISHRSEQE